MRNNFFLKIAAFSFLTITFSCREEMISISDTAESSSVQIKDGTVRNGRLTSLIRNLYNFIMTKLKMKVRKL